MCKNCGASFKSCFSTRKWYKTHKISPMPPPSTRCPGNINAVQNWMPAERHTEPTPQMFCILMFIYVYLRLYALLSASRCGISRHARHTMHCGKCVWCCLFFLCVLIVNCVRLMAMVWLASLLIKFWVIL